MLTNIVLTILFFVLFFGSYLYERELKKRKVNPFSSKIRAVSGSVFLIACILVSTVQYPLLYFCRGKIEPSFFSAVYLVGLLLYIQSIRAYRGKYFSPLKHLIKKDDNKEDTYKIYPWLNHFCISLKREPEQWVYSYYTLEKKKDTILLPVKKAKTIKKAVHRIQKQLLTVYKKNSRYQNLCMITAFIATGIAQVYCLVQLVSSM